MRYLLLLLFFVSISAASLSQIGYAEFPENSSLENWKIGKFNNVNGTIVNLGLKSGTYVIHWKFNVDSAFWNSQKVLHIANPISYTHIPLNPITISILTDVKGT